VDTAPVCCDDNLPWFQVPHVSYREIRVQYGRYGYKYGTFTDRFDPPVIREAGVDTVSNDESLPTSEVFSSTYPQTPWKNDLGVVY
jgi:hypothetical protein